MKILITGCAGFIGFHLCLHLLKQNKKYQVFGIDNLNNYYDLKLKKNRLSILKKYKKFKFFKMDITNNNNLYKNFMKNKYNYVVNLAAQAGVRYSVKFPEKYFSSNVIGFFNMLECSRIFKVKKFIYASTSSVYGNSKKFPLDEDANTDKPLSFYAATKKSNEVFAYSYSNIYKLNTIGLRFFTVYGPYGRPDMSLYQFTNNISKSKKINLYNYGLHNRDFTYIDDVIIAIEKIINKKSKIKQIPYEIYNIASGSSKKLKMYVSLIEKKLNKKAIINYIKMQVGDVKKTHGKIKKINSIIKYKPSHTLEKGIEKYIFWFKRYYRK